MKLKDAHIIRSRLAFEAFVIIFYREKGVMEADYYFEEKESVYKVARRLSKGEHGMAPVVVTIPEGYTVAQISETFASKLINFNESKFLSVAGEKEGYFFPDTYFFLTTDTEQDVIRSMSSNFEKKLALVRQDIHDQGKTTGRTEKDIIIMASLIEGEANGDTDREIISGILWKRIAMGMRLQVDVAPITYETMGLPKKAVGNPGLAAIKAAMYPKSSVYLYYLHDKDGIIRYAKTFAEHRQNVLKYLK